MKRITKQSKRSKAERRTGDTLPATTGNHEQRMDLPRDEAELRRVAKTAYLEVSGANLLGGQLAFLVKDDSGQAAQAFVAALMESVRPRDAIEEMLVLQMAWTHARLAKLSSIAGGQSNLEAMKAVHDAADRAANTFRRQMLALAECRRPARTDSFMAIKQANVAQQQVVQNVENPNFTKTASNEVESSDAAAAGPIAATGAARQTMALEHRPQDGGGQGPMQNERPEARPAQR